MGLEIVSDGCGSAAAGGGYAASPTPVVMTIDQSKILIEMAFP
jgi:hypothetical protein